MTALPAYAAGRTGTVAYWLTAALTMVSQIAAFTTFSVPGILTGPPAMNGSARGTALVVGLLAVPVLVIGAFLASSGSVRGVVVWAGAAMYLSYNAVMFLFATPFNELFLVYVAMLALSLWTAGTALASSPVRPVLHRRSLRIGIVAYMAATIVLNTLAWLRQVVPALGDPHLLLDGTGLTTNPVFVQDLAVWLPLATVATIGVARRRAFWTLLSGAFLTMWVLESVSIAVDQAFGHDADPASPVASAGAVRLFAVVALAGLVPLVLVLRGVGGRGSVRDAQVVLSVGRPAGR